MSAAIKFTCPHCERVCKVPAELGGKQGRCPGCRKGLEVPTETPEHLLSGRQTAAPEEALAPLQAEEGAPSPSKRTTARQSLIPKRASGRSRRRSGRNRRRSSQGEIEFFDETGPILCPSCKLDVPAGAYECPHCQTELRREVKGGLHWAIPLSFLFMPLIPVIGLLLAQFGLRRARQRNNYENVAWVSILLNGANLTFGILYMLKGLLAE